MSRVADHADAFDARRARAAPQPLRAFNEAGVLRAADVHVAGRLGALAGDGDPAVALALALAVRGPRLGHVCVDLAAIRAQVAVDGDEPVALDALPWPAVDAWLAALRASPLVAAGDGDAELACPLRLVGTRLYLDRYWREERQVAADLLALATAAPPPVDRGALAAGLERLFAGGADASQRRAAAVAVLRRLTVVAGGPGSGKTTTVARIVALALEQAASAGRPAPLVALAAPTGKAAARLAETVHAEAALLDVADDVRARLLALDAATLHRLLGWRPGSRSRFRHDRGNRLAHDVVIVDETSMVSLTLMARLVEAVRPDARLVLVGDPDQLTSIEAGAVLADVVGAGADDAPADLGAATAEPGVAAGVVHLDRLHRFGDRVAALAAAVRDGDADAALAALRAGDGEVAWLDVDAGEQPDADALEPVRRLALEHGRAALRAAAADDALGALAAIGAFRVLCAHRRGPHGALTWSARIESWLRAAPGGARDWYPGRPLLVTANDDGLRLANGDTGVVVAGADGHARAAFERRGAIVRISPARLSAVDTVYAMTIHKAQGSQFDAAAVLLPPPDSPLLTRELLYTAVTRARSRLIVAGGEDALRAAIARPVARASGLRGRLSARDPRPTPGG